MPSDPIALLREKAEAEISYAAGGALTPYGKDVLLIAKALLLALGEVEALNQELENISHRERHDKYQAQLADLVSESPNVRPRKGAEHE